MGNGRSLRLWTTADFDHTCGQPQCLFLDWSAADRCQSEGECWVLGGHEQLSLMVLTGTTFHDNRPAKVGDKR